MLTDADTIKFYTAACVHTYHTRNTHHATYHNLYVKKSNSVMFTNHEDFYESQCLWITKLCGDKSTQVHWKGSKTN